MGFLSRRVLVSSSFRPNLPVRMILILITMCSCALFYIHLTGRNRGLMAGNQEGLLSQAKFSYDPYQKLLPAQVLLKDAARKVSLSFRDAVGMGLGESCPEGYISNRAENSTCADRNWWGAMDEVEAPKMKIRCVDYVDNPTKARKVRFGMLMPYNRTVKTGLEMMDVTRNCADPALKPLSPIAGNKIRIAYVIHTQHNAEQVLKMLTRIYVPQNIYLIHVDARSSAAFKQTMDNIATCFKNIFVMHRRYSFIPGGWGQLRVDVEAMSILLNLKWEYLINMRGTDYPLKSNVEIHQFLFSLKGQSLIPNAVDRKANSKAGFVYTESATDETIYRYINKTKTFNIPTVLPFHYGKAYNIYSRRFCEFADIQKNPISQALFEFGALSYQPAEYYWATLAKLEPVPLIRKHPLPKAKLDKTALRYSRNVVRASACPTGISRYGACVFGLGDLSTLSLLRDFYLFAGEFDLVIDHYIFKCVEAQMPKARTLLGTVVKRVPK